MSKKLIIFIVILFYSQLLFSAPNNKVICRGGYLFLIVWDYTLPNKSNHPVVVQIMGSGIGKEYYESTATPQPIKCTKKDEVKFNSEGG